MHRLILSLLASLILFGGLGRGVMAAQGHAGGPPPPDGPMAPPLSFTEARNYASRAANIVPQLQFGGLSIRQTPQGPRLSLCLLYQRSVVAEVFLKSDLSFAERSSLPMLPDIQKIPPLSSQQQHLLQSNIQGLSVAGLAQPTGPDVRVALLFAGMPVSDLRFDRASGMLLLAGPPPKRPRGRH